MTNPVEAARLGLIKAQEELASSSERVARGDASAEALIDNKMNANNVKLQAANLKTMLDLEEQVLDILA